MNWLDIIILAVLVFTAFLGLRTGLIKAVITLAGLVGGIALAGQYYVSLGGWLSAYIPQANLAEIVAFAIIIAASLAAASVVASLLQKAISLVMLGWVNRLGGAFFGLTMGATVIGALLAVIVKVIVKIPFFDGAGFIRESAVSSAILQYFPLVLGLLPAEFDAVRSFFA